METPERTRGGVSDPIALAWASLTFLIPTVVSLVAKMGATDLAYHIRAGVDVLHGKIPRVDTYTFTVTGTPWLDQQWLAQGIFALLHGLGGWPTLLAAQALMVGVSFWLVYLAARSTGVAVRTGALLALGGFVVSSPALGLRPQLLAVVLFAVLLWVTAGRRSHPGRLWAAPVLAAICANVHGSFAIFPVVVGIAWLEDRRRRDTRATRTLVIALISAAATCVTPFGPKVWAYVYDISTNPIIRNSITEWKPLTLTTLPGWLAIGSALAIVAYLIRRTRPVPWTALVTLAAFFLLALSAQRAIVWWGMVAPVVVAGLLAPEPVTRPPDRTPPATSRIPAYAIIATLTVGALALAPWWRGSSYDRFLTAAPPGLTAAAEGLPPGTRTLVDQSWGSWFEFALPDLPVFVDSRIEIIPANVWHAYGQVGFSGADWKDTLDQYDVGAIVASNDWALLPELRTDPGWQEIYADGDGAVFIRA